MPTECEELPRLRINSIPNIPACETKRRIIHAEELPQL